VIDDDAAFATALAELLLERGWEGYPCTEVPDALARIREPYAGLFVDAVIPGTHGATLLRESLSLYPRRPAVLMSGRDVAPDILLDVLGLGPVTFMAKPLASTDLDLALQMFRALLTVSLRAREEPPPGRPRVAGQQQPRIAAKKVLVVDDDRLIQSFLKVLFEKAGYQVTPAVDAMQGLMVARKVSPDLIVLDIAMPGGGGYHVFERLRKIAGTIETPVLIHSAIAKQEVEKRIPEGPRVVFLSKPCLPDDILAAAGKLLGGAG
jgi:two-component system chemotaxis response regulator CheY